MNEYRREKPRSDAPESARRADSEADMTTAPRGPLRGPEDLHDTERVHAALARWDELDSELLALLERHPQHGPKLAVLRAADRWLERQITIAAPRLHGLPLPAHAGEAGSRVAGGPCPSADELYDLGRGPGYRPVDARRRAELESHVQACSDCEDLVRSLAAPPPVPLDFELPELDTLPETHRASFLTSPGAAERATAPSAPRAPEHAAAAAETPIVSIRPAPREAPSPSRRWATFSAARRWAPLAAAASVVVCAGLWFATRTDTALGAGPRPGPLLRGHGAIQLFYPRERVLDAGSVLHRGWPSLANFASFELAPQPEAEGYRVEVFRAGADAFTRGERVWSATSSSPILTLTQALPPGRYTWEAWTTAHGIEGRLGTRDFEVVSDAGLEAELARITERGTAGLARALAVLDAHGFASDARTLARTLPAGELRERWLAPSPGR